MLIDLDVINNSFINNLNEVIPTIIDIISDKTKLHQASRLFLSSNLNIFR